MRLLNNLWLALAMYSVIPAPPVEWSRENMRYALCFFPVVGLLSGAVAAFWLWLSSVLAFGLFFRAAICTVIPVLITGGLHLDGFCDTVDALSSHQDKDKKLIIIKDPHMGAFAVIWLIVYFLAGLAFWTEIEITARAVFFIACGYALARTLAALTVAGLHPAKASGLLHAFADTADKKRVRFWLLLWLIFLFSAMTVADTYGTALMLVFSILLFLYYRRMAYRNFGGVSGDTTGFFITLYELILLFSVVLAQKII